MTSFIPAIDLPTESSDTLLITVLVILTSFMAFFLASTKKPRMAQPPKFENLPEWAQELKRMHANKTNNNIYHFSLREWHDSSYRRKMGWHGSDLCHNQNGSGVQILDYYWNRDKKELIGICWFGPDCESHGEWHMAGHVHRSWTI